MLHEFHEFDERRTGLRVTDRHQPARLKKPRHSWLGGLDFENGVEEFALAPAVARDVEGDELHAGFRAGRGGDAKREFAARPGSESAFQYTRLGGEAGRRVDLDAMSLRAGLRPCVRLGKSRGGNLAGTGKNQKKATLNCSQAGHAADWGGPTRILWHAKAP